MVVTVTVTGGTVTVFECSHSKMSASFLLSYDMGDRGITYLGLALPIRGVVPVGKANPQERQCDSNKSGALHDELVKNE